MSEAAPFTAPHSQKGQAGHRFYWMDVLERMEEGLEFSLCRKELGGDPMEVPNEFFYWSKGELHCEDMTDARLDIVAGEEVGLLREYSDRWLIQKNGVIGFLDK